MTVKVAVVGGCGRTVAAVGMVAVCGSRDGSGGQRGWWRRKVVVFVERLAMAEVDEWGSRQAGGSGGRWDIGIAMMVKE